MAQCFEEICTMVTSFCIFLNCRQVTTLGCFLPPSSDGQYNIITNSLFLSFADSFHFSQNLNQASGFASRCTGDILYREDSAANIYQMCATVTPSLASRFCWDTGINLDTSRSRQLFRCQSITILKINNFMIFLQCFLQCC